MSKLCRSTEIGLALVRCQQVFMPVPARELCAWQKDWAAALRTAPYMRLTRVDADGPLHRMLNLTCVMRVVGINMKMVQGEVERVWSRELAADMKASHCFRETDTGFEFRFLGLDERLCYVTGSLLVHRKE